MNSKERCLWLQQEVKRHDLLYSENRPEITDSAYDALYEELVKLEAEHPELVSADSPTQKIIENMVEGIGKSKHDEPMLSLQKTTSADGLRKWKSQVGEHREIVAQYKLDGLTLVVTYEGGKLIKAVTRGDGVTGELVTENAKCINNLPKSINYEGKVVVRGEVVIEFEDFEKANIDGKYSNPRNLASGTMRQLDSSVVAQRNLKFIAFDLVSKHIEVDNEVAAIGFMQALNFDCVKTVYTYADNFEGLVSKLEQERAQLDFMIDGLVFKFSGHDLHETLGYTAKYPRFAIAYKFSSQDATTILRSVQWQVGKSGQITPVANFDVVTIDGVSITKATLHNFANIEAKDIRLGDTILVARANDVIPYIVMSIKEKRPVDAEKIDIPSACPVCGAQVERDGPIMRCPNVATCQAQVVGRIIHFASRDAMNIDSLGESTVLDFFREAYLQDISDIYTLHEKALDLVHEEGYGVVKVKKLLQAIEDSKLNPMSRVLYGLSIKNVGKRASKLIANHFKSMGAFMDAIEKPDFKEVICSMDNIGESIYDSIMDWYNEDAIELVDKLYKNGLYLSEPDFTVGDSFNGLTFVITGKLSKPRKSYEEYITANGGKVSGSVSAKTSYLLLGEGDENSTKAKKAKTLGIAIINEEQLEEMLKRRE